MNNDPSNPTSPETLDDAARVAVVTQHLGETASGSIDHNPNGEKFFAKIAAETNEDPEAGNGYAETHDKVMDARGAQVESTPSTDSSDEKISE